jgi:16S rRNA (guanine966-N2)-methyltransferase
VKAPGAVRVVGGALRGRRLRVPAGARPTAGRVREALAAIWRDELEGAEILDLFAGSGALGIEALSRGALRAVFVESSPAARRDLQWNLEELDLEAAGTVVAAPAATALTALAATGERFGLIFADPPYAWAPSPDFLAAVERVLAPGGIFALEHSARSAPPPEAGELVRADLRRYGETAISLYRRVG